MPWPAYGDGCVRIDPPSGQTERKASLEGATMNAQEEAKKAAQAAIRAEEERKKKEKDEAAKDDEFIRRIRDEARLRKPK